MGGVSKPPLHTAWRQVLCVWSTCAGPRSEENQQMRRWKQAETGVQGEAAVMSLS